MPDYPMHTLFFVLPTNFDTMSREDKGRVLLHLLMHHAKGKFPNLSTIAAEYTGSGDSWDDAQWMFYGESTDKEGNTALDSVIQLELHDQVQQALDDFLSDWVSDEHPGWENNDGGFGNMTIDLNKRSITLVHNDRFVSSEVAGTYTLFDDSAKENDDEQTA